MESMVATDVPPRGVHPTMRGRSETDPERHGHWPSDELELWPPPEGGAQAVARANISRLALMMEAQT